LAGIKQNYAQQDKCEQHANSEQSDTVHLSMANNTGQSTVAVAVDYSHLYVYKKNINTSASWNEKTDDFIALSSSSSSSEEDENEYRRVEFADTRSCNDDNDNADNGDAETQSSVAVTESTATTSVHCSKSSKLYRTPNTGLQIANPNKKKKKRKS